MTITELISRIEAGDTSRELDRLVHNIVSPADQIHTDNLGNMYAYGKSLPGWPIPKETRSPKYYTTSIDASEALPGKVVEVSQQISGKWEAYASNGASVLISEAPTEAAARTAAKLRAMEKEQVK